MTQPVKSKKGFCPRRPEHVVWKVLDGRGILLNLEDGAYFEVNPVALVVWQQCDGRTDSARIAEGVSKKFRVDLNRATRDVMEFLRQLQKRQLITTAVGAAPTSR